jgi:hypothetical protein
VTADCMYEYVQMRGSKVKAGARQQSSTRAAV